MLLAGNLLAGSLLEVKLPAGNLLAGNLLAGNLDRRPARSIPGPAGRIPGPELVPRADRQHGRRCHAWRRPLRAPGPARYGRPVPAQGAPIRAPMTTRAAPAMRPTTVAARRPMQSRPNCTGARARRLPTGPRDYGAPTITRGRYGAPGARALLAQIKLPADTLGHRPVVSSARVVLELT